MLKIEAHARIARPAGEVFAFLADFTHMPLWNYYIRTVTQVTPGAVGMGTVFDQVRRTDRQQYVITEFLPEREVAVRTQPPARALRLRFQLEADPQGGTRVIETWNLDTGLPGLLERLAQARIQAAVAANLRVLAILLETGEARLPDGRQVRYPVGLSG